MNIAGFEKGWIIEINYNILKDFPRDFLDTIDKDPLNMPAKPLIKGSELFGAFEITDIDGYTFLNTSNISKLKYILYANRNTPSKIEIPKSESDFDIIVKKYENHLNEIIKMIELEFYKEFHSTKGMSLVINKIFRTLNLHHY